MSKTRLGKVMVSRRAVLQRINRRLAPDGRQLKAYRQGLKYGAAARWWRDLGEYYIVDVNRNAIERGHVDLEVFGRQLEVLAAYEAVDMEES
jgi:hypothetical protein